MAWPSLYEKIWLEGRVTWTHCQGKFSLGPGWLELAVMRTLAEDQGDGNDSPQVYKAHGGWLYSKDT